MSERSDNYDWVGSAVTTASRLTALEQQRADDRSKIDKHEARIERIEKLIDRVLRYAGIAAAMALGGLNLRQSGLEKALAKLISIATQ